MKSRMRNTVLSALLAAPAFVANAQQGTTTLPSLAPVAQLAPLGVTGGSNHEGYYYYSDKQIADSNLKSKEVSKEISTPRGADIYIEIIIVTFMVGTAGN